MKNFLKEKFISLGFTELEYKFTRSAGLVMLYSDKQVEENLENNFKYFKDLGLEDEKIVKLIKLAPSILILSTKTIESNLNNLINLGYTKENVIKMIKITPNLIVITENDLINRIYQLKQIGYKEEDIIKIGRHAPYIYTDQLNHIKEKIANLISLGYTKNEVIKMTTQLSSIFFYSLDNIQNKIEFLDYIGAHDLPLKDPNVLIQSEKISYARYEYLKNKGIDYEVGNFRKIFMSEAQFQKQYGITREQLLERYDISEFYKVKQKSIN